MKLLRLPYRLALPLMLLTAGACGGDNLSLPTDESGGAPSSRPPSQIEKVGGDNQGGVPGSALSQPLTVRVFDEVGEGVPEQTVTWVVTGGGGTPSPAISTTDEQGLATTSWTLGTEGSNSIDARVIGVGAVTFSAIADNSGTGSGGDDGSGGNSGNGGTGGTGGGTIGTVPSAATSTVSADPVSIQAGTGVSTIRVTVRDAAGAPVPGAGVTLSASGSGNRVTQPAALTGTDGVATGTVRSTVAGTKDIVATVNGAVQIAQTAQVFVSAAVATQVEMVNGNNQTARTGQEVSVAPAVRVTDATGRPVSGYGVTFVVTQGGGSVAGSSQITNADGIARVGSWTLGNAGPNTLEARAGSLNGSPVVFHATATEPNNPPDPPTAEPHHFVFQVQPHDVRVNEWFTVVVAIVDVNGNVVPLNGTQIYLGLFRAGASTPDNDELAGDRFVDTRDGVATFNLFVTDEGTWRFRALSDYLPKELGPYGPELFSNTFEVR